MGNADMMEANKKSDTKEDQRKEKRMVSRPGQNGRRWVYIFWILLAVMVVYFLYQRSAQKNLSYSDFIEKVKNGNVASVVFRDHQVKGEFAEEYLESKEAQDLPAEFVTHMPVIQGSELMDLLEQNDVQIDAERTDQFPWIILLLIAPWVFLIGYMIYGAKKVGKQMEGAGMGLFNIGRSKARKYEKSTADVHFDDVAGLDNAKKDLREIIDYLKRPEKFLSLGAEIPKGILLMGPPGCGKTMLAKAVAGEVGVPFYQISGSEFIEMFVGVGASRVREMFNNAKKESPSIIFIDEIDSIGRSRGTGLGGGHDEREQTLNQILSEMDGFEPHESVIVIAATNRPDVLDPALTRPGRFDRQITLPLPDKKARRKIFEIHVRRIPVAEDVDLDNLAAITAGFSGADIRNLVNEAALLGGRKDKERVQKEDFEEARDKIMLGMAREDILEEGEKKWVCYHESGHALVAQLLPNTDPLQKVTIIPRGRSLGATQQVPEIDRHNLSKSYLLGVIAVRLAGRATERLVFQDVSNGAADDLKHATGLVRRMVCQWGMSEKLGPMTFSQAENHVFLGREITQPKEYSQESARAIDDEVKKILEAEEQRVSELLKQNRDRLDKLAQALLENETLEKDQIVEIVGTD